MTNQNWDPGRWERVTDIFRQCLELDVAAREEFLRQLQMGDSDTAQAVARMLAADAAFQTDTPPSATETLKEAVDPILPAGTQLGVYEIDTCLGSGGMGRVYRAHRSKDAVAQTVAIKCLRFQSRDAEFLRRFLRERRILAQLNHPGIARFLDAGADAAGQPFVVIEYVDGLSIIDYARAHKLSLRTRVELLLRVMDAVAYAHRQLVVHRDIKPGNVLVTAGGEPRLLDFGIAKQLQGDGGFSVLEGETAVEQRAFSLAHAAPEQWRGESVSTACDVYALGVLAYELLTEQAPLVLAGLSFAEAERRVRDELARAPSDCFTDLALAPDGSTGISWRRALRGDLDRIVLHALRKEPGERYPSVDAFSEDLRRHLDQQPISLRSGQRLYRLRRFVRRHRLPVALAAGLMLAVLASAAALWRQNNETRIQRDAAIAQSERAESLNGLLLSAFEAADPSRNGGRVVPAREVLDQAARRIDQMTADAATRVSLLNAIADVYRTLGLARESANIAQRATEQSAGAAPAHLRSRAWRSVALAQLALGEEMRAEQALDQARAVVLEPGLRSSIIEEMEQEQLALQVIIANGRAPEAVDRYAALYARAASQLGQGDALTLRFGAAYAEQLRLLGRLPQSAALIESLLQAIPDAGRDPTGVRLLGARARLDRSQQRLDAAIIHSKEYVGGVRLLYGERHRSYVSALDLLSSIEEELGNFDQAIKLMREMDEIIATVTEQPDSSLRATMLNNLAGVLLRAGQLEEARVAASEAVRMGVATLPGGSVNIALFRTTLADILLASGEHRAAITELDQSEALFAAAHTSNSPGLVRASNEILRGEALLALGQPQQAHVAFERGWTRLSQVDSKEPRHQRALRLRERLEREGAAALAQDAP